MMPRPQSMKSLLHGKKGSREFRSVISTGSFRPGPDTEIISTVPLASAVEACMRQAARAATTTNLSPVLSLIAPPLTAGEKRLPPICY